MTSFAAHNVSLKEKIGQMLILGFKGTTLNPDDAIVKSIIAQQIGGVILFDYDYPTKTYDHNIKSPIQLKQLTEQLQHYTKDTAVRHQNKLYPLLISIDYEGGQVNRLKESLGFPKTFSASELGASSHHNVQAVAEQMAQTLQASGINMNFAPVLDVNVNPNNPVIGKMGRSFSDDPEKVVEDAAVFSKAYHDKNILCVYKHFPGHGSSTTDTHKGFVDVTSTWKPYELDPYRLLFADSNHCAIVMTAHVVHEDLDKEGYPASLSKAITTGLLRDKLHFNGVVVTDDLQMKAITDKYSVAMAVRLAINAGADLLVFGNQLVATPQQSQQLIDQIESDVKTGKISEKRIDESYQRIMKLKAHLRASA